MSEVQQAYDEVVERLSLMAHEVPGSIQRWGFSASLTGLTRTLVNSSLENPVDQISIAGHLAVAIFYIAELEARHGDPRPEASL